MPSRAFIVTVKQDNSKIFSLQYHFKAMTLENIH